MLYIGGTWFEQESLEQALEKIVNWLSPYIKIGNGTAVNDTLIRSVVLQQPVIEWHKKFKETLDGNEAEFPCSLRCAKYERTIHPDGRECLFTVLYNHEYGIVQWSLQDKDLLK